MPQGPRQWRLPWLWWRRIALAWHTLLIKGRRGLVEAASGDEAVNCNVPCGFYRQQLLRATGSYRLPKPQTASCLCGAVRLRLAEPPIRMMHCHCSMCRRQAGGAFITWAAFNDDAIEAVGGAARTRTYNSSDFAYRRFCPRCGSTVALNYYAQPGTSWLAAGIIDGDVGCCPDSHIMLNHQASWYDLTEHVLHRFPEGG
mmetsp:Transcript_25417/g.64628  ORF Transcript_25417/g.64628 Transcript_25417/m.64628 type:complete len:200 (-) Transcript_25417:129-728(-)